MKLMLLGLLIFSTVSVWSTEFCNSASFQNCGASKDDPDDEFAGRKKGRLLPRLTPAERKLVEEHPFEAAVVWMAAKTALDISKKRFPRGRYHDERDAIKHFIWAGLLYKYIGKDRALVYLSAHEDFPQNRADSKKMDLANNALGIKEAQRLELLGRLSAESLEIAAMEFLDSGKLVVLVKRRDRKSA